MQLQDILYTQGFGTRRECAKLIRCQQVMVRPINQTQDWCLETEPQQKFDELQIEWQLANEVWHYHEKAYLMLHKPSGYECTQKPNHYPTVYSLLPQSLRQRPNSGKTDGVQAVGRLDQDTTGILLFSDDGAFIHKMTSPKKSIAKIYQIKTAEPITALQQQNLLDGVLLCDSVIPVQAQQCKIINETQLSLTITQGKYHQVKRMVAAVNNKVVKLHRSQIGELRLPDDLPQGQWRWLTEEQLKQAQSSIQISEVGK